MFQFDLCLFSAPNAMA